MQERELAATTAAMVAARCWRRNLRGCAIICNARVRVWLVAEKPYIMRRNYWPAHGFMRGQNRFHLEEGVTWH